jgi:Zn-dependent protease with chaperone function
MMKRPRLYVLILGVPLITFLISIGIQSYLNSNLRENIRKHYPDADPERIASLTVDDLCRNAKSSLGKLCSANAFLKIMQYASIAVGLIGLGLLAVVRLAGLLARENRKLLLTLFKPGLYAVLVALILLILAHGALVVSAIYWSESILIGLLHVKLIALIGIGALVGVYKLGKSSFSLIENARVTVIGRSISKQDAPKLWKLIGQLCEKLGSLKPENVVVGLEPNFFVTEADVICLNRSLKGRTLYCSLSLARILSDEEFASVLGHELGHFRGMDTQYSKKFYPIYRGTLSALETLHKSNKGLASISILPAMAILSYFLECFAVAENRISRIRELAADNCGASVVTPLSLATALVKLHAYSGFWTLVQSSVVENLQKKSVLVNLSKTYSEILATGIDKKIFNDIGKTHIVHPTDTHPPLATRLKALHVTIEDVSDLALNVQPATSAISLFEAAETIEEDISVKYQLIMSETLYNVSAPVG